MSRRIVMKVFPKKEMNEQTIKVLKSLQAARIVSVVKTKNCIAVARCHVNHGKNSPFQKRVERYFES